MGSSSSEEDAAARTPVEDEDDLFSLTRTKVLDMLCEGPIYGFPESGADALKYVYLNATPVLNENNKYNFNQLILKTRFSPYDGESTWAPNEFISKTVAISKKIYKDVITSQAITNHEVTSVRIGVRVPRLQKQDMETGDIKRTSVSVIIKVNGNNKKTVTIKGKTTGGYVKEVGISVDRLNKSDKSVPIGQNTIGLQRKTKDSITAVVSDDTYWDYMVERIPYSLYYPFSALSHLEFDARQFAQVPTRAYELKLMKVKVPSSYNPETREYGDYWDGTFSEAQWTDNPAWIVYDILLNKIYGVGEYFTEDMIDKWSLYEVAKYCDEMLPTGQKDDDGEEILEPRFSCNCYFNAREDAFQILSKVVSSFRGLMFWAGGKLCFVQDSKKPVSAQFSDANVLGDGFVYSEMDKMSRYTAALVYYQDKRDLFRKKAVYVEDQESIKMIGWRQVELDAFGCTSESQAYRMARWAVYSTLFEKETVNFKIGEEAMHLNIGDIIQISNSSRHTSRRGGRILSISDDRKTITLDSKIYIDPLKEAKFYLCIPQGEISYDEVSTSDDYTSLYHKPEVFMKYIVPVGDIGYYTDTIDVAEAFDEGVMDNAVWLVETEAYDPELISSAQDEAFSELMYEYLNLFGDRNSEIDIYGTKIKQYRVLNIKELEGKQFDIVALEYSEKKFDYIERGYLVDTVIPQPNETTYISPPYGLKYEKIPESGTLSVSVSWEHSTDVTTYPDLYYSITYIIEDNIYNTTTKDSSLYISDIPYTATGTMTFNIAAVVPSIGARSPTVTLNIPLNALDSGNVIQNIALTNPVEGNDLQFNADYAKFRWELTDEYASLEDYLQSFEISVFTAWNGYTNRLRQETVAVADLAYLEEYRYTYNYDKNITDSNALGLKSAQRSFRIEVVPIRKDGVRGNKLALTVNNPQPDKWVRGTDFNMYSVYNGTLINVYNANIPDDYNGFMWYYSTQNFSGADIMTGNSLSTSGGIPKYSYINYVDVPAPGYSHTLEISGNTPYYMAMAPYDNYGKGGLYVSDTFNMNTYGSSTGTPPARPSSLLLDSYVDYGPDLSATIKLTSSWNSSTAGDVLYYEVGFKSADMPEYETYVASSRQSTFSVIAQRFTSYTGRIRAANGFGLLSDYYTGNVHTTPNVATSTIFSGGSGLGGIPVGGIFLWPKAVEFPTGESLLYARITGQWYETGSQIELWQKYKTVAPVLGSSFRVPSGQFNQTFGYAVRLASQ
jgi:hypothetical protein